jgi:maltose alpha-D-glucosyltransferase / alpha-amylase
MPGLDLWYKNAIVYCVDVETFMDGNGDGVGDFAGMTKRLDYLAGIGITCIWLLPFYPTPNRDNGYDVLDYYGVDPRLGSLGDFVEFARQVRQRGMRLLIDLVVNHTSDQHPWFQAARSDKGSKYRDYYVWSETKPKDAEEGVVFPGVQKSIWTFDRKARAYYHHRFYEHQPDLNIANPAVRDEIRKVMGFWLELGVSGFRMDAAPFVIELVGVTDHGVKDPHAYLREFREFLSWRRGDAIMLAEANVAPKQVLEYFGDGGDRLQMLFNFLVNQNLFLALAREEAEPLSRAWRALPPLPETAQWASFLRNHDEIDLGRLSDEERAEAFAAFGPEPEMQLYDRGIRRRLAPMLNCDRRRIELAYSLMFSLPGTPVLWYGDEIGMGDDLSLPERNSVRTPMQWTDAANAGFSSAPSEALIRPVVSGGDFSYERINVAAQHRDSASLLNWMEQLIRTRKERPEIGWGRMSMLEAAEPNVFAHCVEWDGSAVLAVHNLAGKACTARLPLPAESIAAMRDIFANRQYESPGDAEGRIHLDGYGYRWFGIGGSGF